MFIVPESAVAGLITPEAAFEAVHLQRFGFISPDRAILYDMLSVEAIGDTTTPELPATPQGSAAERSAPCRSAGTPPRQRAGADPCISPMP